MMVKLLILLLFGSLVQLGIILIANPLHVNKRANIWFGLFLFIWASFWLDEIILMIGGETIGWRYAFLLSFIQYLSPLIFYVSIKFFTNPDYKFGTKGLFYLILPSVYLFFLTLDKVLDKDFKIILIALLLIHAITYTFLSLFLIREHKKHIQQFASNTVEIDLRWLEYIVWSTLFLVVAISIFNLLFFEAPLN
ncbi:MAG: hypothetical protein Q7V19_02190, partial [Bacteroidales bacterium]|nr:hypothetical protein [Bacteroidales bacterium]